MTQMGSILLRVNLKHRSCVPVLPSSGNRRAMRVSPLFDTAGDSDAVADRLAFAVVEAHLELAIFVAGFGSGIFSASRADLEVERDLANRGAQ